MTGDRAVFLIALLGAAFLLGMQAGYSIPEPKVCPKVEGHQVVSTTSTNDGEHCNYVRSSTKGWGLKRVKL